MGQKIINQKNTGMDEFLNDIPSCDKSSRTRSINIHEFRINCFTDRIQENEEDEEEEEEGDAERW